MSPKKLVSAALVTGAMFVTGAASAATLVTFSPTATNGAQALALSADANFQAVGFQSNLYSNLVINGNSGVQAFSETGLIDVTSFMSAANTTVASGVGSNYHVFGNFTISGFGSWTGSQFTMSPGGLSFSVALTGDPGAVGGPVVNLGTASLAPGNPIAFAIAFGSVAAGSSGSALATLSADLNFTPGRAPVGLAAFSRHPCRLT
ncbi:MAG: hypothetical protein IPP87_19815 [Ideonella sp.]|nr:hypothetical protein [Ideonella sp.]